MERGFILLAKHDNFAVGPVLVASFCFTRFNLNFKVKTQTERQADVQIPAFYRFPTVCKC